MLPAGSKLGAYEVVAQIGAGGMGEVYRARDTRLNRDVAIKVLPAHLADKPELRERFEREARTIASLNHPHICTLYDIGHQDGTDFLVMEHLEGETLAQRLLKGRLPLEQVLQYAIEIADALDKAHRKGVTHRDLKPGNIMLTKSGTKLLDFGLAKLKQEPTASISQLSTQETLTEQGTILGTYPYMAPEQVEGKTDQIDARTDIFAFGAVVYEMATGKKAFEGKTSASVMAKILETDPPPMSALQPMTPPALDRVVKKCLQKDRDDRWQSARDVTDELKWVAESGPQITSLSAAPAEGIPALVRRPLLLALGALLLGAVVASLATWNLKPASSPPLRPVSRFTIALPPGDRLAGLDRPAVALSPDGTHLAYVATRGGTQQIYLRAMDSMEVKSIPGTEGALNPFFSPDGQWLGFFAGGKLKKISVSGGAALTLTDAATTRGASWGKQGTIAFTPLGTGTVLQMSDSGGSPQPLTQLHKGDTGNRWPDFLPGGRAVLFAGGTSTKPRIGVRSIQTGEQRVLIQAGGYPRYAPSGHLVYVQSGTLMATPFDLQRLEVSGEGVPVVESVLRSTSTGSAQYSVSETGWLVYVPGGPEADQRKLVWVSRNGTEQPLAAPVRTYEIPAPRLSRDGKRLGVVTDSQVWLYDVPRETLTRFTFEGDTNNFPVWSPDSKRIAFDSDKEGPLNLFWQRADGSGGLERLTRSEFPQYPLSFSPDGQLLAFVEVNPTTSYDIWVLHLADRKAQPFLRTTFLETAPQFSPDGHWLAYVSNESGRFEVYVQPYPGPGGKWQISTDGGTEPMWNPNGRELFYRNGDKMMAVEIATQPTFSAGKARVLFERHYMPTTGTIPAYDVTPDGQRFLMASDSESATPATQINVVLNWTEELKRLVPAGTK